MSPLLQDVIVSAVALGALASIVYRTRATFTAKRTGGACPSCPSSRCASRQPQGATPQTEFPLHIIRPTSAH